MSTVEADMDAMPGGKTISLPLQSCIRCALRSLDGETILMSGFPDVGITSGTEACYERDGGDNHTRDGAVFSLKALLFLSAAVIGRRRRVGSEVWMVRASSVGDAASDVDRTLATAHRRPDQLLDRSCIVCTLYCRLYRLGSAIVWSINPARTMTMR
jgi:hypothetical protein